jgi:hypothetical protein
VKRSGLYAVVSLFALAAAGVSGATSHAKPAGIQRQAADRVCTSVAKEYKFFGAYPPGPKWVWTIPSGCVFLRDRPQTADCQGRADDGCALPPDVHVRYQRRSYVFHLTLKDLPAKAKGIWTAGGQRIFIVAHDGRPPKTRQRLFVEFTGREFDGFLQSGPSQGQPDLGSILRWEIQYTLDRKKGLCCPRVDPGNPGSPFDVAPQRLTIVPTS